MCFHKTTTTQEVLSVLNSQTQNKTLGSWLKGGTFHLTPSAENVVAVRTPSPAPLFLHCIMFSVNLAEAHEGKTVGFRHWPWFPAWDGGYQESISNEKQTENHYFSPYIPYIFILERILWRKFFFPMSSAFRGGAQEGLIWRARAGITHWKLTLVCSQSPWTSTSSAF